MQVKFAALEVTGGHFILKPRHIPGESEFRRLFIKMPHCHELFLDFSKLFTPAGLNQIYVEPLGLEKNRFSQRS